MSQELTAFQKRVLASMEEQGMRAGFYLGKTWLAHCFKHGRRFEKFSGVQRDGFVEGIVEVQICPECTEGRMRTLGLFGEFHTSFHLVEEMQVFTSLTDTQEE